MAPVIHLVRHAQGYHNLSIENQWIRDPDLTDLGKQQCEELCKIFPYHDKITHLVASPIRRTIFTCQFSFAPAVKAGKKIVALQDAQEVSLYPCDVGSDVEPLEKEFGDLVDFGSLTDDWNKKTTDSKYYPDPKKLEARARDTRLWLLLRPGEVIYTKYDNTWTPFAISRVFKKIATNADGLRSYSIDCWNYMYYDGQLRREMHTFDVHPFSGEEAIHNLPVIPARFFAGADKDMTPAEATAEQIRLGKLVWELYKKPSYKAYHLKDRGSRPDLTPRQSEDGGKENDCRGVDADGDVDVFACENRRPQEGFCQQQQQWRIGNAL
ncbi:hypothetical protein NUW58_g2292 [Xylaria curta]|uniref:Uncharacterized protein n=1 Tax=Xylaria curta TaxID=42375 RepID=A0ACC1PHP0_9PEZI|nr:hypothetical protein NUW58_g2292 [Xylaria curta]